MTTTRKIRLGEQTQGQIPSDQLADGTDTAGYVPTANGDGTQSWDAPAGGAPAAHAASHENGGADEIDATGLTGAGSAAHEADATDAHDASAISFDDTGLGITAADVQEMGEQLDAAISAGGIPATIFDAAGDLIVASAADTAVRLPMGTALQTLRVNAGATGLEYAAAAGGLGAWTTWTPTWVTTGTAPALGNGTLTGRYKQLDANTYWITLRFQAGTTTTFGTGTWSFTGLPVTVAVAVDLPGHILDSGTDNKLCAGQIQAAATSIVQITPEGGNIVNNTVPMTWATSDTLRMAGLVEV